MLYGQLNMIDSPPRVTWTWSGVYWVLPGAGATRGSLAGISYCSSTQQDELQVHHISSTQGHAKRTCCLHHYSKLWFLLWRLSFDCGTEEAQSRRYRHTWLFDWTANKE